MWLIYAIFASVYLRSKKPASQQRLLLAIVVFLFSCRNPSETARPLGSEPAWSAGDSLTFYFPQNQQPALGFQYSSIDTLLDKGYSWALFSFREPVFYRRYSPGGVYRFLWLRSFDPPVVFVLSRLGDQVTLTTKVMDGEPKLTESRVDPSRWAALTDNLKAKTIKRFRDSVVAAKADRKAGIVLSHTKPLTPKEWVGFEQLLGKAAFWQCPATRTALSDIGFDGSEWVIESLRKDKYRFVARWSPGGAFLDAGTYLIKLSGLKGEIY